MALCARAVRSGAGSALVAHLKPGFVLAPQDRRFEVDRTEFLPFERRAGSGAARRPNRRYRFLLFRVLVLGSLSEIDWWTFSPLSGGPDAWKQIWGSRWGGALGTRSHSWVSGGGAMRVSVPLGRLLTAWLKRRISTLDVWTALNRANCVLTAATLNSLALLTRKQKPG